MNLIAPSRPVALLLAVLPLPTGVRLPPAPAPTNGFPTLLAA